MSFKIRFELLPNIPKNDHQARCNMNCIWCHNDYLALAENKTDIKNVNRQIQKLLAQAEILKNHYGRTIPVQISAAGEPTLIGHNTLVDFISRLRAMGYHNIGLTTNGTTLNDIKLHDLNKAGLTEINFSLNSLNPFTYQKITGINGFKFLPIVMRNIHSASEMDLYTSVNCVYSKLNASELPQMIAWISSLPGITWKFFDLLGMEELYLPITDITRQLESFHIKKEQKILAEYAYYLYNLGPSRIKIKLSREENICPVTDCLSRPNCNEGCRSSVRVSSSGIQPCGVRYDNIVLYENTENNVLLETALYSGGKSMAQVHSVSEEVV